MFKKRFLQGLAASSILLGSLTISSFTLTASPSIHGMIDRRSSQHSTLAAQFSPQYHLDCFRRTYNFSQQRSSHVEQKDVSNYFMKLS